MISGNSLVFTDHGYMYVYDMILQPSDNIRVWCSHQSRFVNVKINISTEKLYHVILNNNMTIVCSENHVWHSNISAHTVTTRHLYKGFKVQKLPALPTVKSHSVSFNNTIPIRNKSDEQSRWLYQVVKKGEYNTSTRMIEISSYDISFIKLLQVFLTIFGVVCHTDTHDTEPSTLFLTRKHLKHLETKYGWTFTNVKTMKYDEIEEQDYLYIKSVFETGITSDMYDIVDIDNNKEMQLIVNGFIP